jgi:hypothetical protein
MQGHSERKQTSSFDPKSVNKLLRLGNIFNFAEKPDQAISALETATRLNAFAPC